MAKGQKRGNREIKKPKSTVTKPTANGSATAFQLPSRPVVVKTAKK